MERSNVKKIAAVPLLIAKETIDTFSLLLVFAARFSDQVYYLSLICISVVGDMESRTLKLW